MYIGITVHCRVGRYFFIDCNEIWQTYRSQRPSFVLIEFGEQSTSIIFAFTSVRNIALYHARWDMAILEVKVSSSLTRTLRPVERVEFEARIHWPWPKLVPTCQHRQDSRLGEPRACRALSGVEASTPSQIAYPFLIATRLIGCVLLYVLTIIIMLKWGGVKLPTGHSFCCHFVTATS